MIIWKSSSLDDNLYKYSLQIILCLAQNNFFSNNERGLNLILQNDFIISNLEKIYNKLKNIVAASNQGNHEILIIYIENFDIFFVYNSIFRFGSKF